VGLFVVCSPSGHHLPHIHDVEAKDLKAVGNIFPWHVWGKVMHYYLHRVFGNWGEGKIVKIIFPQVEFHD
jgi:hypothetical protein